MFIKVFTKVFKRENLGMDLSYPSAFDKGRVFEKVLRKAKEKWKVDFKNFGNIPPS